MSFVASNERYLPYKSVDIKSVNGLSYEYNNNAVIKIDIDPETVPYLDPRSSALKFDLVLNGGLVPKVLRRDAFAAGIIDSCRILNLNGEVIEEITNYNVLAANLGHYENDRPEIKKKSLTEGAYDPNDILTQPYFKNDGGGNDQDTTTYNTNTFLLPLRYSGVLSNRGKVLPVVALGGVSVEIFLSPEIKCMSFTRQVDKNLGCRNESALPVVAPNQSRLDISKSTQDINRTGVKPNGIGLNTSTFRVGQQLELYSGGVSVNGWAIAADSQIATSEIQGAAPDGRVRLSTVGNLNVGATPAIDAVIVQRAGQAQTHTYTVSNVSFVCGVVSPPKAYVESVQRALASKEGFVFDIKSYQEYRDNVDAAITTATVNIPLTQSRIYSIFCIPTTQENYTSSDLFDSSPVLSGSSFGLNQYQFSYGGKNHPVRRVDVGNAPAGQDIRTTSTSVNNTEIVQQHYLYELEKALENCDVDVKNLKELQYNFVIARALSKYGETYDGINRDFLLNLYWSAAHDNVLLHNFVGHLRRVHCSNSGVVVEV